MFLKFIVIFTALMCVGHGVKEEMSKEVKRVIYYMYSTQMEYYYRSQEIYKAFKSQNLHPAVGETCRRKLNATWEIFHINKNHKDRTDSIIDPLISWIVNIEKSEGNDFTITDTSAKCFIPERKLDEENTDCNGKGRYRCGSGECIDVYKTCDGVFDCWDGSDEMGQCHSLDGCDRCGFYCLRTPSGPFCVDHYDDMPQGLVKTDFETRINKVGVSFSLLRRKPLVKECLFNIYPNLLLSVSINMAKLSAESFLNFAVLSERWRECENEIISTMSEEDAINKNTTPGSEEEDSDEQFDEESPYRFPDLGLLTSMLCLDLEGSCSNLKQSVTPLDWTTRHTWHPTTRHTTWHPTRHTTWHPTKHTTWHPTRHTTWHPTRHTTWHPTKHSTWRPNSEFSTSIVPDDSTNIYNSYRKRTTKHHPTKHTTKHTTPHTTTTTKPTTTPHTTTNPTTPPTPTTGVPKTTTTIKQFIPGVWTV